MSNISKRRKEGSRTKIKSVGDHKEFLKRITKTLYYGQLPTLPCLSLPVTEVSCEVWSAAARGRSVRRLRADAAAAIARRACVSPCALVLALLYLERLHRCNQRYVHAVAPQHLFLVSLMVGNKFLQDDGEDDEVICSEWAASGDLDVKQLKNLEIEFLDAIEWNVYVSEESFTSGLARLERRVALRQARARGHATYTELAAAGAGAAPPARLAVSALAALSLGYAALLASALAAAPALSAAAALARAAAAPRPAAPVLPVNTTAPPAPDAPDAADRPLCCEEWARRLAPCDDAVPVGSAWRWERAAAAWAAADPLRRWLARAADYREAPRRCSPRWLQLGGLGALLAVSDR